MAHAPAHVIESDDVMPNSDDFMRRVTASAPRMPIATPITVGCDAVRMANPTRRRGAAPSAERMPISNRRWTTASVITL